MPDVIYRFRSIDKLLGKKELERREIYMASRSELNDPMEGYKNVTWQGDGVLWENVFRGYLLSLVRICALCQLTPNEDFGEPELPAGLSEDDLPTDHFRKLFADAWDTFFESADLAALIVRLTRLTKPLRRDGVAFVLSLVHQTAFASVIGAFKQHGLGIASASDVPSSPIPLEEIFGPFANPAGTAGGVDFETLAFTANKARQIQALRGLWQFEKDNIGGPSRKLHYVLFQFPDRYLESIVENLLHPNWKIACFTATCENPSSWSVYGDNHKGAALVYRPVVEGEHGYLPLSGITGVSSVVGKPDQYLRNPIKGVLSKVTYSGNPPELEFFGSLGNIPQGKLDRAWKTNRAGERSGLIDQIMNDLVAWRNGYWALFQKIVTTKLAEWKHEDEYRIVLTDLLGLGEKSALVQYEFSCLVGIVFGLRTSTSDKLEIMRQAVKHCESTGRKDFSFWQMTYNPITGRLVRL